MHGRRVFSLTLTNTKLSYGFIAKTLHWTMAACFVVSYCSVYYAYNFEIKGSPGFQLARQYHFLAGISIGMLVLPRLLWKLLNVEPAIAPGPKWQQWAARAGHWLLYAVMILVPVSGWWGKGSGTNYFGLFRLPGARDTALYDWLATDKLGWTYRQFDGLADSLHREIFGQKIIPILIGIHVSAALYHHFIAGDDTMRKMFPRGKIRWRGHTGSTSQAVPASENFT